jgi:hypothetical protein
MSGDEPMRERHVICLSALEGGDFAFAERIVDDTEADRRDRWSYRIREFCCKKIGRLDEAAKAKAAAVELEARVSPRPLPSST